MNTLPGMKLTASEKEMLRTIIEWEFLLTPEQKCARVLSWGMIPFKPGPKIFQYE